MERNTSMMWHFGAKTEFGSKNLAPRAMDLVSEMDSKGLTTSKSRVVGTAIQFVNPSGYLARRERHLEEALEKKGVNVRKSNIYTLTGDRTLVESYPYCDFVSDEEWEDDDFGQRSKFSLPEQIADGIESACDKSENYNRKQKARFVSDAIIAFNWSVFRDLVERIETKEQLLRKVRGEDVTEPTRAYENIRDGVWFEDIHNSVFDSIDLEAIDPEDDVVLPEDHPVVNGEETFKSLSIPKTGGRAGATLAFLRRKYEQADIEEFDEPLYLRKWVIVNHFNEVNPDYEDAEGAVEKYILPHLYEVDGYVYPNEDEIPEEEDEDEMGDDERRKTLAELVKAMSTGPSGRSIKAGVRDAVGADEVDRVRGPEEPAGFQASTMAVEMSTSELQRVLKYLVENVSKSNQESAARKACGLDSGDYAFVRDGDF